MYKRQADAKCIEAVKNAVSIPIVADIHFDYRAALACADVGVDKIRINHGDVYKRQAMYTAGQKDPDFILRPSGEKRLSNFMLWQAAYAELVEMYVLWPDFTRADLDLSLIHI